MNKQAIYPPKKRYDVFISYSHTADSETAGQLQYALQRLAKPWYRVRSMRAFRDETDLSAAPEGWPLIEAALVDSKYFLLLASKKAASSGWVAREVSFWIENKSTDKIFIVLTDGEVIWDNDSLDFDWKRTTAIPGVLANKFNSEPFWLDIRWANQKQDLTLKNPEFLKSVAKLSAPIRGLEVDKLINEAHRQHKRTMQIAYGVGATFLILIAIAFWQFQASMTAAEHERDQRVLSSISRVYQILYINPLQALDEAQRGLEIKQTPEGEKALHIAIEVAKNRRQSREEEAKLTGTGVGYLMERWRQGEVFTKLRGDGRYLLVASKRGQDGPSPPGSVFLISLDNLRTRELSAGEKAHGRRLEYMGFSSSGEEIFVARQFYLDIFDLEGKLQKSVQLEYHAKPTHLVSGMFGSHVLVGDTVGHLMLADTTSGKRPQLEGARYPDATLFIEANKEGTRAIVIFESGRADLLNLQDINLPGQIRIADESIIFAAFSKLQGSKRFLTTTKSGEVTVWNLDEGELVQVATFPHSNTSVGLAAFSRNEERIISLDDEGNIRLWDVDTGNLIISYIEKSP